VIETPNFTFTFSFGWRNHGIFPLLKLFQFFFNVSVPAWCGEYSPNSITQTARQSSLVHDMSKKTQFNFFCVLLCAIRLHKRGNGIWRCIFLRLIAVNRSLLAY